MGTTSPTTGIHCFSVKLLVEGPNVRVQGVGQVAVERSFSMGYPVFGIRVHLASRWLGVHPAFDHEFVAHQLRLVTDSCDNEAVLHLAVERYYPMTGLFGEPLPLPDKIESDSWRVQLRGRHTAAAVAAICVLQHEHELWEAEFSIASDADADW